MNARGGDAPSAPTEPGKMATEKRDDRDKNGANCAHVTLSLSTAATYQSSHTTAKRSMWDQAEI